MNEKNKRLNVRDEWARSATALMESRTLATQGFWEGATSRAYYAAFHATQAVLITQSLQPKTHHGTLYLFNHHFVKTGLIEPEHSQILARLAKYREEADYRHTMTFTKEQTEQAITEVEFFLKRMELSLAKAGYLEPPANCP